MGDDWGMGKTRSYNSEAEWDAMWESETATSTVHRACFDDEDAWDAAYSSARLAGMTDEQATEVADAEVY